MHMEEVKRCQYCGEEILAIAIKCKHCGSALDEGTVTAAPTPSPTADYGWALLAIPIIGMLLLVTWVGNMALIQGPGSIANLIVALVIISTAILAAMEASKLGMKADRKEGIYSPTQWAFSILLLWIISYPWYLFKRRRFGRSNLLVPGIIVAVLFLGISAAIIAAIEQRNREVQEQIQKFQDSALEIQKQLSDK